MSIARRTSGGVRELLHRDVVLWVGHRDLHGVICRADRDRDVRASQGLRDQRDGALVRRVFPEVGQPHSETPGQDTGQVEVVDRAQLDEQLPQALARGRLLQQGLVQPARGDEIALDQELAQAERVVALFVGDLLDGRDRGDGRVSRPCIPP